MCGVPGAWCRGECRVQAWGGECDGGALGEAGGGTGASGSRDIRIEQQCGGLRLRLGSICIKVATLDSTGFVAVFWWSSSVALAASLVVVEAGLAMGKVALACGMVRSWG